MQTAISNYKNSLLKKQKSIVFESDEDDGAAEYHGELQSIIDVIDAGKSIDEIRKAAEWVGESCPF